MTLIPAFFTWLGEKTWYIPRWLDRPPPNITIEPPHDGECRSRRRRAAPATRAERGLTRPITSLAVGGLTPMTADRQEGASR